MYKKVLTLSLTLILAIFLPACGNAAQTGSQQSDNNSTGAETLKIVATTGQITDAVKNIGGDAVDLTGMFGPGVDPHLYVPTEGDIGLLAGANVIFYNGLHLEAQMERALDQMSSRGIKVVAIGSVLPEDQLLGWDSNFPHDPHIWNDPQLWSIGVEAIRDTLVEADPANADLYQKNAAAYLAEIAETHDYVQIQTARIPANKRIMITAHDAFGYFARTYGFEVAGLQGISTESEAGTGDVQKIANLIVERQVPAIFVESTVSARNIEAVQAAVQSAGYEVKIGGQLYSDALGDPNTPDGTYNGMLRHNIDTLVAALSQNLERAMQ